MPRKWIEREQRRQLRVVLACVVIALVLTTIDRPGLAMYALDAAFVLGVILWLWLRGFALEVRRG